MIGIQRSIWGVARALTLIALALVAGRGDNTDAHAVYVSGVELLRLAEAQTQNSG